MSTDNSFDRLTIGLNKGERLALLQKMKSITDPETQSLEEKASEYIEPIHDISTCIKKESFLLRIWLFIKALFTSSTVENVYNEHRIAAIAHSVESDYPGLLSYKNNLLLSDFYNNIYDLKNVADYFRSSISVYEDDQGHFYACLGSLIIPELSTEMAEQVNPYTIPFDRDVTQELRASMIRKMEEILQSIPSESKQHLYEAIQSLEWLRQFAHLPFEKFLTRFANPDSQPGVYTCIIDATTQELSQFAKVLCHGRRIMPEVLEALYMVGVSNRNGVDTSSNAEKIASEYLERSQAEISKIKVIISSIPFRRISCIAFQSFFWQPDQLDGVEDWFVKYKNYWKKLFDQKWDDWLKDKKKDQSRQYIEKRFNLNGLPLVPHRPWSTIWGGLPFTREYSLGFIHAFFEHLYSKYSTLFKTIIGEGDFIQKDNRIEFTDAYNEFEHQSQQFEEMDIDYSTAGSTGVVFAQLGKSGVRTIQSQGKAEALLRKIESDSAITIAKFCAACRSTQLILNGITSDKRDRHYDTLSNISSIQGHNNSQFKQQLSDAAEDFRDILDLIKDLETIEIADTKK